MGSYSDSCQEGQTVLRIALRPGRRRAQTPPMLCLNSLPVEKSVSRAWSAGESGDRAHQKSYRSTICTMRGPPEVPPTGTPAPPPAVKPNFPSVLRLSRLAPGLAKFTLLNKL
jgi:hypothetical protein